MDSEDVHVDVEKSPENVENEIRQASTQPQPQPPVPPITTKPLTPPFTTTNPVSLSAPSVTPGHQVRSPRTTQQDVLAPTTISTTEASTDTLKDQKATVTVLTPTKQHQKVFHTGTKRPVVVLRDIHSVGRPGKRKRSPRRGDSPKRGIRTRRVSLPMQQHPGFEPCVLAKAKVWLPVDVIEEPFIFNEVVSLETWDSILTDKDRERLSEFLPEFSDDDEKEKRESLRRLFAGDNFNFGNPADFLQKKIQSGRLHPNIIKADKLCHKQKYKEYKYRQQRRAHKLLKDVLISRQELLEAAQYTAPHEPIRVKKPRPKPTHHVFDDRVAKKVRGVLRDVRQECGDVDTSDEDERNVLEAQAAVTTKTWFDILSEMYPSQSSVTSIQATTAPKPTPFDVNGSPLMCPPTTQADTHSKLKEADFIAMLEKHQRKRSEEEDHFDLDTSSVHLHDVVSRVYSLHRSPMPGASPTFAASRTSTAHKKKRKDKDKIKKKKKIKPPKIPKTPTPPPTVVQVKTEPKTPLVEKQVSSVKATNHEAPSIKIEGAKPSKPSSVLHVTQVTQPTSVMTSGFFVLLKEFMISSLNRTISLPELENRVAIWQSSPASLLCGWLSLEPNWSQVVSHALRFMSGNIPCVLPVDPRVQYDLTTQMWTWIGQGKDSNEDLVYLFKQWLQVMADETSLTPIVEPSVSSSRRVVEEITNIPSPRMKTDYVVKPSTIEDREMFREQECRRYEQPHKAFTYLAHGYESVVGPVKGVFGKESSLTKAREHSLLVSERPPYVTILSLVRDAVARLPNGEGTRSEVCELLKLSQFISLSMDTHLNTVVSGALDRLHYEKDPCVKYDTTRKIWIYLHRNRTEGEFERIHKEIAASSKSKKATPRQQRPATKLKSLQKEPQAYLSSGKPSSSTLHETSSNDSVTGPRMETPSPTQQSPMSSRMMTPNPVSAAAYTMGQPAMPQIALSSPRQGLPGSKQTVQQQLLNAQLLRSVLPMSGIQVTAIRTSTSDVTTSAGQHMLGADGKADSSGTSLIKAQLLAPRVGQLPVGAQFHPYSSQQHQLMLSADAAARGAQMNPADIRNQLLAQSLARSLTMPSGVPFSRPPMTSLASSLPHQMQAQQIALSLAGARGKQPGQGQPTAADLLKQEMALQALHAGGAGIQQGMSPSGPVNVTLTLKRAQTMDEVAAAAAAQYGGIPRHPTQPQGVRVPTVGSILAGLGMPHANAPIHTRPPTKKRSRSKKSSSQTLANLAMAHTIRAPSTGTTHAMATTSQPTVHATQPAFSATQTIPGQHSKSKVVTIQALTGPQMTTANPATLAHITSASTAASLSSLSQAITAGALQRTHPSTITAMHHSMTSSGASNPTTVTTTTQSMTKTTTALTTSKSTTSTRSPAARRPSTPKSQKISKMIAQPAGRIAEVRYSLPPGRNTPPAASHAAAIHRLALQSLTQQSQIAAGTTTIPGVQKTTPQSSKTSGIHVLGNISKMEEGKPAMATIPMSLLLQGQAMASSGGLPKGALPVLSSQLLGNIPVGMTQGGKGLIFQMPPGSKLVTTVPVTTSGSKSLTHSVATTASVTTGERKSATQATPPSITTSAVTTKRQRSPGRSPAPSTVVTVSQQPSKSSIMTTATTTMVSASKVSTSLSTAVKPVEIKQESKSVPTTSSTNSKATNA